MNNQHLVTLQIVLGMINTGDLDGAVYALENAIATEEALETVQDIEAQVEVSEDTPDPA